MGDRTGPGWWVYAGILLGASGGGYGTAKSFESLRDEAFGGWILGIVSGTVIGGIAAFLLSGFVTMSLKAWHEAVRHDKR
ncbi:MAG: hypothetical protein QM811_15405 [Pirellulales bacterium]